MNRPINLAVCRADFEVAQRRPALAEHWFYEYAHRLLAELERQRAENQQLNTKLRKLSRTSKKGLFT